MNRHGFDGLVDATLLVTVLLIASTMALSIGADRGRIDADAASYAEDTRIALFRTVLDDLSFSQDDRRVVLPNGTRVESFLRLQVHLQSLGTGDLNFEEANLRVAGVAMRLMRPGWSFGIRGVEMGGAGVTVRIPADVVIPETHAASSWTYPALDGEGLNTVLLLHVWFTSHR